MHRARDLVDRIGGRCDDEGLGIHGLHVRIADDAASRRWRCDDREDLWSVSKGVAALAAGLAVDSGALRLGTTVAEALPELRLGDGVADVTLEHLLTMTSGIDFPWFADEAIPGDDLAQSMLGLPTAGVGTRFQYSDASTYVAMRMVAAVAGDVGALVHERLLDPLGIEHASWARCPRGFVIGGSGLHLRTEELARLGRLLRDRGSWRGRQLVSASWVDRMTTTSTATGWAAPYAAYGLAAWQGPGERWRLDGRYGQYVLVDDARGAVVTITAREEERDDLLVAIAAEELDRIV